jgi:meiotically up-regulated gene 157 (Mug157) protein
MDSVNVDDLIDKIYPDFITKYDDPVYLSERAIIAGKHKECDPINKSLIDKIPADGHE